MIDLFIVPGDCLWFPWQSLWESRLGASEPNFFPMATQIIQIGFKVATFGDETGLLLWFLSVSECKLPRRTVGRRNFSAPHLHTGLLCLAFLSAFPFSRLHYHFYHAALIVTNEKPDFYFCRPKHEGASFIVIYDKKFFVARSFRVAKLFSRVCCRKTRSGQHRGFHFSTQTSFLLARFNSKPRR